MAIRLATAEWANPTLVEESYAFRDGMVWLGRSGSDNQVPLGYSDDRHVCLVSGSRGGKGTSSIVNNLILWPGSVFVIDGKGENATVTAARRGKGSKNCKGLGQTVHVLDPFKAAQVDDTLRGRFNPLDALDPAADEAIDEAGRIADAIVVMHPETKDPFWDESGRALVKGIILHILTAPQFEGRRNLVMLRKLILRGDWETIEVMRATDPNYEGSGHGLLLTGMMNNPAFDGLVAGLGDSFRDMFFNSPKQFESILQVANRNTEFIDSPAMQRCLEASDFALSELKTRPEGLSVYLCLPQRYMNTHYRWLRMIIALTVTEMEKVRGRPATGHPVLMVLDEFAGLKRMEVVEQAVAQIAGYGVKLFFVLQSLEQLKAVYKDNWETFLANSGLKVFFNLEDNFSRDYVSKLIGETEVIREVRSATDSQSETESTSRSTARGQSLSTGRSTSTGTSENEGSSQSVSTGENRGVSTSRTTGRGGSKSFSWDGEDTRWLFNLLRIKARSTSEATNWSTSETEGTSQGWNQGRSEGTSRGTSRSRTDGTSETSGTSISDTEGTSSGTSKSRTAGASETIQKRALITPDEIGQVFARIDDRAYFAYPGLALVVISGARPFPVRRVNYYDDFQFAGLFDPHPDHPFAAPKELTVDGASLGKYVDLFNRYLLIAPWAVKTGQLVTAGASLLPICNKSSVIVGQLRAPRGGMVGEIPVPTILAGPWLSLRYYEDGAEAIDPFAEIRVYLDRAEEQRMAAERALAARKRRERLMWRAFAAVFALVVLGSVVQLFNVRAQRAEEELAKLRREQLSSSPPTQNLPAPAGLVSGARPETKPPGAGLDPPTAQNAPAIAPAADRGAPRGVTSPSIAEPPSVPTITPYPSGTRLQMTAIRDFAAEGRSETLAFSPDGRLLATGNEDGTIRFWDAASGRLLRTIAGSKEAVYCAVFDPGGGVLASGGSDGILKFWNVADGTALAVFDIYRSGNQPKYRDLRDIVFSPDGRWIAIGAGDNGVHVVETRTGANVGTLSGHKLSVTSVALSANGRMLASGSLDETIKLWDVASRTELRTLTGHTNQVTSLLFSRDGRVLASGGRDRSIKLWDVATGGVLRSIPVNDMVWSLALSPDGRILAAAIDDNLELLNAATGEELASYASEPRGPRSVSFSPDGSILAFADAQITLWTIGSSR